MISCDTHYYDGKINKYDISKLKEVEQLPLEYKKQRGEELLSIVNNYYLRIIINDIGSDRNYDQSNKLSVDDLIYLCWEFKDNSDFISLLNEQCNEMKSGFCSQGRTHRIFQILLAFMQHDE